MTFTSTELTADEHDEEDKDMRMSWSPEYAVPVDSSPTHFKEQNLTPQAGWKPVQPSDHFPRGEWWQDFGDPVLDDTLALDVY